MTTASTNTAAIMAWIANLPAPIQAAIISAMVALLTLFMSWVNSRASIKVAERKMFLDLIPRRAEWLTKLNETHQNRMAWIWHNSAPGLDWPPNVKSKPDHDPLIDMVTLEGECEWLFGEDIWRKVDELIKQQHTFATFMDKDHPRADAQDHLTAKALTRSHELIFEIVTVASPYMYVGDIKQNNSRGARRITERRKQLLAGFKQLARAK